jgi:cytidylate kinase
MRRLANSRLRHPLPTGDGRHWRMARPRIHIIGGLGSGKSFVAGELSRCLGVPAYDLDDLFWDRGTPRDGVRASADERDRRLAAIVAQDGWIIEGVYYGWLAPSFDAADMIIERSPSRVRRPAARRGARLHLCARTAARRMHDARAGVRGSV